MPVASSQKIFPRELIFQRHPQLLSIIKGSDPWDLYANIKEIGSGTYGHVYKAKHKATGTYAAMKSVKIDPSDDLKAILTELYVLKDCHHANIVEFFCAFLTENRPAGQTCLWIAMEYCGGKSLQDIYATTRRPFEEATIAFVMRETVRGLAHMHAKQQIHRDIKGANILLTKDGRVKLADFGISAQITETLGKRMSFIGTPYWMAPEVADVRRKGGYDERCDIWAAGITCIELAELEPPMFSLHPMKALQLMATSRFRPPKLRDKAMWSGVFHDFLKTALRLNPKSRPSAGELLGHQFLANPALSEHLTVNLLRQFHEDCRRYQAGVYEELLRQTPEDATAVATQSALENGDSGCCDVSAAEAAAVAACGPAPRAVAEAVSPSSSEELPLGASRPAGGSGGAAEVAPQPHPSEQTGTLTSESRLKQRSASAELLPDSNALLVQQLRQRKFNDKRAWLCGDNHPTVLTLSNGLTLGGHGQQTDCNEAEVDTAATSSSADQLAPLPPQQSLLQSPVSDGPLPPLQSELLPPPGSAPAQSNSLDDPPGNCKLPQQQQQQQQHRHQNSDPTPTSSASPATVPDGDLARVRMGAGLSKIFEDCPLKINAIAKWTNPRNEAIALIGANEGLYCLKLSCHHDPTTMVQLVRQRCLWLYVYRGVLISLSGRHPQLYRHDLNLLFPADSKSKLKGRMAMRLANNPPSSKIPRTKGCMRVSARKHPETAERWLACAMPDCVLLLQWDNARRTFLEFKSLGCPDLPQPLLTFELLIRSGFKLPFVCVGVLRGRNDACVRFRLLDLNKLDGLVELWPPDPAGLDEEVEVTNVSQLQLGAVLVCYRNLARVFHLDTGRVFGRTADRLGTLSFDFTIESVQALEDAVLCFYKHGFQAKSFLGGEVVQDVRDRNHVYRFVGFAGQNPVLERRPVDDPMASCDLVLIIGHVSQAAVE